MCSHFPFNFNLKDLTFQKLKLKMSKSVSSCAYFTEKKILNIENEEQGMRKEITALSNFFLCNN